MRTGNRSVVGRVTTRDLTDFRDHLRRDCKIRRSQRSIVASDHDSSILRMAALKAVMSSANPAKPVKELRRQQLAPKGLDRSQVRRLLREIELRQDIRAGAIFSLFLYTGCRVSGLPCPGTARPDSFGERSGSVVFRLGKGNKQRGRCRFPFRPGVRWRSIWNLGLRWNLAACSSENVAR